METKQIKDIVISILIIAIVFAVGLFALNQFISFRYKTIFLETPCELCVSLNPAWEVCRDNYNKNSQEEFINNLSIKKNNVIELLNRSVVK